MTRPNPWGQRYVSASVTEDGRPRALVRNTRITLWFVTETRRLSAHAGCNTTMFDADITGDVLEARAPHSTLMACSPESEDQDLWLIEFLLLGPTCAASDDDLVLTGSRTRIAFDRLRTEL
ncbi:META domain-containing protein [Nocardia sp. NPDC005366]|uniref:META domain-containing protein n=1 Tax=Nocardia sp. NPDC005366 TaxID=3156878 RepID=UPI0033A0C10E